MCTHCNNSNCSDCNQYTSSQTHICDGCQEQSCEGCAVKDLSTDCSVFTGDSIECDSVVVVAKNTILSDALANIISWSCTKFTELATYLRIVNVGTGASIYAGDNLIGEKKLRRLKSTNGSVIITQGTDDIDFSVPAGVIPDGTETKIVNGTNTTVVGTGTTPTPYQINALNSTYSNSNLGTGAQIYKDSIIVGSNTQFNLRKIKSSNSSVNIVEGADEIDITVVAGIVPDGSETKLTAGTNTSVTGTGTIATPYVINSTDTNTTYSAGTAMSLVGTTFNNTAPDQTVVLTQGGATTITGTYPNFTISSTDIDTTYSAGTALSLVGTTFNNTAPDQTVVLTQGGATTITGTYPNFTISSTNTIADGSETKINSGVTTVISGTGTIASPYILEITNLQKVITYPADFTGTNYTLTNADNNYTIIVDNAATAVTIIVPSGLTSKIGVGFIQKGTADVTFTASGTTIQNPTGLKIKGQYYQTFLSQELSTNNYFLGGNTKI